MNIPYKDLLEKAIAELERCRKAAPPVVNSLNLHIALANHDCTLEVIQKLLEKEDVKQCNEEGLCPLHIAVVNPNCELEIIDLLINSGASVHDKNYLRETPLHTAVAQFPCRLDMVRKLLEHGASVDAEDFNYNTPLHRAAMNQCPSLPAIECLVNRRANVRLRNCMGDDVLQTALQNPNCSIDIVKEILNQVEYIDAQNIAGLTPLHTYLQNQNCQLDVLIKLLDHGANINARTWTLHGWGHNAPASTPIQIYMENPNCQLEIIKELLNRGARRSTTDDRGWNLLHYAIRIPNCYAILNELLQNNDSDINKSDNYLNSVLHHALKVENLDENVICLLLKHGADVNLCNELDETPLHKAVQATPCNLTIIQTLLDSGALPCATAKSYVSPLGTVMQRYKCDPNCFRACAKLLLKYAVKHCFEEHEHLGSHFQGYNLDITLCPDVNYLDYGILSDFIDDCCHELVRMKTDMMTKDFSLYDFVRNSKRKSRPVITTNVLIILSYNSYPIYSNIIADRLDRSELVRNLHELRIFTKYFPSFKNSSEIKVTLDSVCLDNIIQHLTKEDLLSLVLAYYDPVRLYTKTIICNSLCMKEQPVKRQSDEGYVLSTIPKRIKV